MDNPPTREEVEAWFKEEIAQDFMKAYDKALACGALPDGNHNWGIVRCVLSAWGKSMAFHYGPITSLYRRYEENLRHFI